MTFQVPDYDATVGIGMAKIFPKTLFFWPFLHFCILFGAPHFFSKTSDEAFAERRLGLCITFFYPWLVLPPSFFHFLAFIAPLIRF